MIDNVLIVSSNEQSAVSLVALMRSEGCTGVSSVNDSDTARRACSGREFSLVVINTPLSDGFGDELALELLRETCAFVVMIVRSELEGQAEKRIVPFGGFVVGKPLDKAVFHKAISFIRASRSRMRNLQSENVKLHKKVEDSRIINRAKYILMEYLSMSESQAHKFIEKQAMDLRLTKLEVAKNLLSTYDS